MDYNQLTKKAYNKISKDWDLKRAHYWEPVKKFLESFENKKDLKLLDLGCGTGRFLQLSSELGFETKNIIGLDYSVGQLNLVKEKGFQTQIGELTLTPFENESFDIIICIAAHHHLLRRVEQLKSLIEMKRILKPTGIILLSNWFPEKKYVEENIKKNKFEFIEEQKAKVTFTSKDEVVDRYYYLFKEEELIKLCEEAGFNIEKTEFESGNFYLVLN